MVVVVVKAGGFGVGGRLTPVQSSAGEQSKFCPGRKLSLPIAGVNSAGERGESTR